MKLGLALLPVAMAAAVPCRAVPSAGNFVYCSVASTSPRGQGLIVTEIFRSRSERQFIETAFVNFLHGSYAPYGNGWIFADRAVTCQSFEQRRKAEVQRALDISRVQQPMQTVFNVLFQIG